MTFSDISNAAETRKFALAEMVKTGEINKAIFAKAWAKWVRFANNFNDPYNMAMEQGEAAFMDKIASYYRECQQKADGLNTSNRDLANEVRQIHSRHRRRI